MPASEAWPAQSRKVRPEGKPGRTLLQLLPFHQATRPQRSQQALSQTPRELEIQETLHLPRKAFAVAVPPDFLHPRHPVHVEILHTHHFLQPEGTVCTPDAAGLHATVRSLADPETRN